ncbi:MAG: PAS domain S-box protein [Prolixibacteraceae bacterium]|jgi:PAS domain S-box-containing protein|nr:PAS domain S-box protein [Prolixibacteraceae bacterium]
MENPEIKTKEELLQEVKMLKSKLDELENLSNERSRHDEALKEREDKFRRLFELSPIGKSMTGFDGSLHVNKAFCGIVGYTEKELKEKHWKEITHPDDIAESEEIVQALIDGKINRANYQKRYIHKNGNIVWTSVITALFTNKDGSINSFLTTIIDITDQKKTEETLNSQTKRLSDILEGTNAGTWDWNVQTGAVVLNERWANIMGKTLEELAPIDINTWINSVHTDDLPTANAALEKHFKGKSNYFDMEFRQPHKKGGWVWVNARGKVIEWTEDGKPLQMSGTHLDITDRKLAEKNSQESGMLLTEILNTIPIRVFWKDLDLNYLGCILPFAHDAGLEKTEDVVGKTDYQMFIPEHAENFRADDKKVMDTGIPKIGFEEPQENVEGFDHWVRTNKIPLKDKTGKTMGVLGTSEDITEKQQAEEELKKYRDQLEILVQERTAELESKNKELNNAMKVFVGREMTIRDLQARIKALGGK